MEYKNLSRLVYLAAGLFVAFWFIHEILQIILLFFFAIVITIVLNAPVTWLQRKKVSRTWASLIVFFTVILLFGAIAAMVVPKIVEQVKLLITNLPGYLTNLSERIAGWLGENSTNPASKTTTQDIVSQLPSVSSI